MQKLFHAPDMARESMKLSAESQPPPAHKNIPLFNKTGRARRTWELVFKRKHMFFRSISQDQWVHRVDHLLKCSPIPRMLVLPPPAATVPAVHRWTVRNLPETSGKNFSNLLPGSLWRNFLSRCNIYIYVCVFFTYIYVYKYAQVFSLQITMIHQKY